MKIKIFVNLWDGSMMGSKWFGKNGYTSSGYVQIRARLEYIKLEELNESDLEYEVRIIRKIISEIPNVSSRMIYLNMLERELQ